MGLLPSLLSIPSQACSDRISRTLNLLTINQVGCTVFTLDVGKGKMCLHSFFETARFPPGG